MIYEGDLESEGLWAAKSLGICSPDERKEICFSIRVPSELGNEWALRKSGVKWIFSVEGEDLPQEEGPSIWHSAPKTGTSICTSKTDFCLTSEPSCFLPRAGLKGGKNEKSKEKLLVSRRNSAVVGILFSGRCSGFESYESSFSFESRNRDHSAVHDRGQVGRLVLADDLFEKAHRSLPARSRTALGAQRARSGGQRNTCHKDAVPGAYDREKH